ncbi:hypothetical protein [Aureimonas populi]|uniref:Uncharacterized protein n=1 Tax=Aureimonas populi TaxID=1701758 RepID=A0ABW5CK67_9HYPH|nr:hypothetical protein [Aureimonas populi]
MADETKNRRDDARLDASLSVLGDEGKEPHVGRVGDTPIRKEGTSLEEELAKGEARSGEGSHEQASEQAAKDAIRAEVDRFGKSPTS